MDDKFKETIKGTKEKIKKYAPETLNGDKLKEFIEYALKRD